MMLLQIVCFVTIFACTVSAQHVEDPLCVLKSCPSNRPCKVVIDCPTEDSCNLTAICMENLPQYSHTGVCQVGQPILIMRNGSWEDTQCYPSSPCPNSTYCNTELMDTYATCCRSDQTNAEKPGQCPVSSNNDTSYCSDTCNTDGDCRWNLKCCQDGCSRRCLGPARETVCPVKACPNGTFCYTREMPSCVAPGRCFLPGHCVPCPPVCDMACSNGFQKDAVGCPVCQCATPSPRFGGGYGLINLMQRQDTRFTRVPGNSLWWALLLNRFF